MKDEKKTKAQLLAELRELRGQVEEFQKTRAERAPLLGILDSTTDYVAIATPDGQVTFVNRGGRRLIGLGEDQELSGLKIADTHPPWASELVLKEGLPTALRDGTWRGETALLRHDGVEIPVSQLIMAHRSPDGEIAFFSTIMRDMSEAKRAERERLAHLRMLEALDQINRAIGGTDDLDQMMADVLDTALSIFGADRAWLLFPCDPDAPTWQVPMERTVPEYPGAIILGAEMPLEPGLARVQRQLLESEAPIRLVPGFDDPLAEAEARPHGFLSNMAMAIHPKVGRPWMFGLHQCSHPREWTDEESRIFEQIGHRVADALTNLLTRRDLQESEEKYRDLIEQEKDIIYTLDLSGQITFASPAVTQILGYLPEELIGRSFSELIPEERRPRAEADFLKVLAAGETTSETVLLTKDLQPRVVEFSSTVIKQGGRPIGARGIARDITARKRAEQERLAHFRMLEALDQINRAIGGTDDLDQMMSDVLDTTLSIFEADQAWLQFPCDPDSPTWQVPMMRTVPEYSAPIALGVEIPAEPEFAEMMRRFLESDAPLVMSPEPDDAWLADFAEKYGFKSSFAMAIHPKVGPAWVFGVHLCSHPRVWTEEESRILLQIGRRVADALTSLLTRRDLRESEEKFRNLFEGSVHSVSVLDRDGVVLMINPAGAKFLGRTPEQCRGRSIRELLPEGRVYRLERITEVFDTGQEMIVEDQIDLPAGPAWRRVILQPVRDAAGRIYGVQVMSYDITERKLAEEALEISEERYRSLYSAMNEGASLQEIIYDESGRPVDYITIDANPAFESILGIKREDALKTRASELYGTDEPPYLDILTKVVETREPVSFETYFEPLDKHFGVAAFSPQKGRFAVLFSDITERKRAEEALALEREQLLSILDSVDQIVYVSDPDTYEILFVNRALQRLLGKDPVGGLCHREFQDLDQPCDFCTNEIIKANKDKPHQWELHDPRVDHTYALTDRIIRWPDGRDVRLQIATDITAEKQAEQERLAHVRMLEALDQINRAIGGTDDLDQMMADVLDATLAIFEADRAWLFFPCDPDAPTWRVPMERTLPEYPSPLVPGVEMPVTPELAEEMRNFLRSETPVSILPDIADNWREGFRDEFGFRSLLAMAIHPKVGPPWMFGLHQCSYPRVWTDQDKRILQEIGRRMADALTSLLSRRDLKESEEKYRDLIENVKEVLYTIDLDGHITFVSPMATEMLGYRPEELVGRNFMELVPEDSHQKAEEDFRRLFEKGELNTELPLLDKDLRRRILEYSSTVIKEGGQPVGLRGIGRDITERKQAEEALRESEEKFRELVEHAQDGIVIVHRDLVDYVNPAYTRLVGYEREELAGKTFTFLIDPPERDKVVDRYRRRMAGEDVPHVYETRLVHKDGQVIEVEFNATTVNYQGETANLTMVRDITERKRAERERLAHVRMLEALDRVNRAIGGTDDLDQMMSDVVDATLSIFGADRAWLMFPCDPDAPFWQVPIQRTVPEYPSVLTPGVDIPKTPIGAKLLRMFLESEGPHILDPATDHSIGEDFAKRHQFQTQLAMVIHPKVGPPWVFGLHQCSYPRVWTDQDKRILQEIGRRVGDALTSLLTRRDLAESEEKFRELVERAQDGIVIISQGQIVYINPAFLQMVGQSPEDLHDRDLGRFIHPQERDKVIDRYRRRVAGEDVPSIYETRLIHTDGRSIDVEFNAAMFNYQGERATLTIVRDITERKQAEEALRDSERRYRELFNSISDFVYTHDLEGRFQALNPVAADSLGYAVEEVLGRDITEFMPETDRAGFKASYLGRITGQGRADGRLVLLAKDGTEHYLEYSSVLVRPDSGPAYVSGAARDVTERVQAEREVKKLEQQLVQAQKMEAIGRLAGGVAHDFNNLLSVINGYSELLLRGLSPGDPMVRDLEQIKKAGFRAADLTNQLLAFSRRQVIKPRVLDLNLVVAGVEKMLQRLIGEHIDLSTSLAADLGSVKVDPGQVEQVIMNLAVNARDAMPDGGVLSIQTDNIYLDENYFRDQLEAVPGPYVMLAVSDTGQGMDEQTRAQAFEPFFTTKAKGEGTGLGLATVYGIVKQSDGNITVSSEPGQGTTFKIYLPRVDEAAEDLRREAVPDLPTRGSETVLLVEDDDLVRQLASEVLKGKGYQVVTAVNGHDAMTSCQNLAGTIDLLVTDVVMPGMSGRELVEHATKMCPEIKVLYMSGYTDEIIARHGVLEDGVNLISKPFSVEALARKVRQILDA